MADQRKGPKDRRLLQNKEIRDMVAQRVESLRRELEGAPPVPDRVKEAIKAPAGRINDYADEFEFLKEWAEVGSQAAEEHGVDRSIIAARDNIVDANDIKKRGGYMEDLTNFIMKQTGVTPEGPSGFGGKSIGRRVTDSGVPLRILGKLAWPLAAIEFGIDATPASDESEQLREAELRGQSMFKEALKRRLEEAQGQEMILP